MAGNTLASRQKSYESSSTSDRFIPGLPVVVRLDGKSFHTFTKKLAKPFDTLFVATMAELTAFLVQESSAVIGYTQSDEITLVLYKEDYESLIYFGGYRQKIETVLASKAGSFFATGAARYWPDLVAELHPSFDARAFIVPSKIEAYNAILWRVRDCVRNSITALAQSKFSHSELNGKNSKHKQEMLWQKHGINWNDLPRQLKEGTFIAKRSFSEPLDLATLAKIPEKVRHTVPDVVIRRKVVEIAMPPFASLTNHVEVIFDEAEPVVDSQFSKEKFLDQVDEEYKGGDSGNS